MTSAGFTEVESKLLVLPMSGWSSSELPGEVERLKKYPSNEKLVLRSSRSDNGSTELRECANSPPIDGAISLDSTERVSYPNKAVSISAT
jgi:hypothetical protein